MAGNFRLDAVLRYRRSIEQKWQAEVARTLMLIVAEQDQMEALRAALAEGRDRMGRALAAGVPASWARAFGDFERGTQAGIDDCGARIAQYEQILRQKRRALVKATTDRKVVDHLKDLFLARRARALRAAEQKDLDDFAAIRHRREGEA